MCGVEEICDFRPLSHLQGAEGGPKNWHNKIGTIFVRLITSSNINRFSQFFHCQSQEKICNNTITKDPTTPQVCRYTTL